MPTQFRNPVGRLLNKLPPRAQLPARLFLWCVALFIAWHSINYLQGNRNLSISGQVLDPAGQPMPGMILNVEVQRYRWWAPRFLPLFEDVGTHTTISLVLVDSEGQFDIRANGFSLNIFATLVHSSSPRGINLEYFPEHHFRDIDYRIWFYDTTKYESVVWRDVISLLGHHSSTMELAWGLHRPPEVQSALEMEAELDGTIDLKSVMDYVPEFSIETTWQPIEDVAPEETALEIAIKGLAGYQLLPTEEFEPACPEGEYVDSFTLDLKSIADGTLKSQAHRFYVRHPQGKLYAAVEIIPRASGIAMIRYVTNNKNDLLPEQSKHLFGEVESWEWSQLSVYYP